jgi:hypothetical protein
VDEHSLKGLALTIITALANSDPADWQSKAAIHAYLHEFRGRRIGEETKDDDMAKESVTISHKITANAIATTVRMPGKPPMTKTWQRMADGSFVLNNCNTWEDEDLPEEIAREAERTPSGICGLIGNT